jgi:hypothetical protein
MPLQANDSRALTSIRSKMSGKLRARAACALLGVSMRMAIECLYQQCRLRWDRPVRDGEGPSVGLAILSP